MHTLIVILGGLVLFGVCLLLGRWSGIGLAKAALCFVPIWLIAAGVNMWVGVSKAGYSVAAEFPIFLFVFAVPAAVAALLGWKVLRD